MRAVGPGSGGRTLLSPGVTAPRPVVTLAGPGPVLAGLSREPLAVRLWAKE